MVLVGVRNEPQGQAYLPPGTRTATGGTGHLDEWAGVSMCTRVFEERVVLCVVNESLSNFI